MMDSGRCKTFWALVVVVCGANWALADTITSHSLTTFNKGTVIQFYGLHGEPVDPPKVWLSPYDRVEIDISYSREIAEYENEHSFFDDDAQERGYYLPFKVSVFNVSRDFEVYDGHQEFDNPPYVTVIDRDPGQGADEMIFNASEMYGRSAFDAVGTFHFIDPSGTALDSPALPLSLDVLSQFGGSFEFAVPFAMGRGRGSLAPVPEPSTWLSVAQAGVLMTLSGLWWRNRRSRRNGRGERNLRAA